MRNLLLILLSRLAGCSAMPQSGDVSSEAEPAYSLAGTATPILVLQAGLGEQGDFSTMLEQSRADWRKLTGAR